MATVFLAEPQPHRTVAIKILKLNFSRNSERCVRFLRNGGKLITIEDKRMKRITLAAVATAFTGIAVSAGAAAPAPLHSTHAIQQGCPAAPAVANAYLRAQAGRKLSMTRGAVISEITKLTGADGEFAGLKPCDSGYPNAVRFYIDEVIKAGTNNSTPQT